MTIWVVKDCGHHRVPSAAAVQKHLAAPLMSCEESADALAAAAGQSLKLVVP